MTQKLQTRAALGLAAVLKIVARCFLKVASGDVSDDPFEFRVAQYCDEGRDDILPTIKAMALSSTPPTTGAVRAQPAVGTPVYTPPGVNSAGVYDSAPMNPSGRPTAVAFSTVQGVAAPASTTAPAANPFAVWDPPTSWVGRS